MSRHLGVAFAFGLAAFSCVGARAEPLGFKGLALGSEFAPDPKYDCRPLRTPMGDRICGLAAHARETIANAPVRSLFRYYYNGRLTAIVIHVGEPEFQAVVVALSGKYGKPELATEAVKNYQGERFENRTYRWRQADGALQAMRYSGRLDQSSIRFIDEAALRRIGQSRSPAGAASGQDL